LYKSEKQTIFNVLSLYLTSTLLLIATLFAGYYFYKQSQHIYNEKEILKKYTLELEDKLNLTHKSGRDEYEYPRFKNFKSAIYDIDKNLIFSTFDTEIKNLDEEFIIKDKKSYLISNLKPYFLGAAYMVVEKKVKPLYIIRGLIPLAIIVVIITIITSFFLVKLVLTPLRNNVHLLDNFIKDTTHELNTPITTILANIETLNTSNCDEKSLKKLQRIETASMGISDIYQDLIYILLNHKILSKNEKLNISEILDERIKYFTNIANTKNINFQLEIKQDIYFIADKQKIDRLIDNIISNAIKYTKKSTTIKIILSDTTLSIIDEGKGMSEDEISKIFERYSRFDNTQGGFGIGYSIIKSIADEYNINIDIKSQVNVGTEVILKW